MYFFNFGILVLAYFQPMVVAQTPCIRIDYAKIIMEFPEDPANFPTVCNVVLIARSWLLTERFCLEDFDLHHGNPNFHLKIDINGETSDLNLQPNTTRHFLSKSPILHDLSKFEMNVAQSFVMTAEKLQGGGKTCTDVIPEFEDIKKFLGKYVCTTKEHSAKTMFINFVQKYIPSVTSETICNVDWQKGPHPKEWVDAPEHQINLGQNGQPVMRKRSGLYN